MFVRDITPTLKRAMEAFPHWSPSRAGDVLERLRASVGQAQIDWDRNSGETWGRLLVEGEPVLALSSLVPFALVRTPVNAEVFRVLDEVEVLAVSTPTWEQRALKADPDIVQQAFHLGEWSVAVDPEEFSASELWWMTV